MPKSDSDRVQTTFLPPISIQDIRRLKAETEKQILELLREFEKKSEGAVTMALVHRNQVIGKEHGEIVAVNLEVKVL